MCERFTNRYGWRELHELFGLPLQDAPEFSPRYNIAATQSVPIVRLKNGARQLAMLRWGLVPATAKDLSGAARHINAPAETAADKPLFKSAFLRRRCLVPADGFYVWRGEGKAKQAHFITLKDKAPFAFAGLWEWWRPKDNSGEVQTFAILTAAANPAMASERVPVTLAPEQWPLWLAEKPVSPGQLQALLKPLPPERMTSWPVGRGVNDIAKDGPGLVEPV